MTVAGREVVNFGSDSFLGLDEDPRVREAIARGLADWGTHNGASRAFSSVRACVAAEERLAAWLGTEAALIYPSVTLANLGAIPALVTRHDFIAYDEFAHNSMQEGIRLAKAGGTRSTAFAHNDCSALERVLREARPYRSALVCVDGVYSMSGELPPLVDFAAICQRHDAVFYVDDAHGTGVLGTRGRGTVGDALGGYENTLVVGSLSKGLSCAGGFVGCPADLVRVLKARSNTWVFGGPVPPAYLEGVCAALEIVDSPEYDLLKARLDARVRQFVRGAEGLGLTVLGGLVPIVSVLVGDEEATLRAGRFLFDAGYYVQSVTFPAVPFRAGVLRVQLNASHPAEAVTGLLEAFARLARVLPLPGPSAAGLRRAG
jgi:7-keto-8-aminopelargonate synthetase-like enzyme